ncbi:MAG: glyoxalase [Jannaschia sp.]
MDLETVDPARFGRSLTGIGVNLLTREVRALAGFAREVLGLGAHRLSDDFALLSHGGILIQVHRDATFGAHPILGLVPEGIRGGGVQLYLLGIDPDVAASRADAAGAPVIEPPADKPHGLRECTILSPEGYAFSPAVPHGA